MTANIQRDAYLKFIKATQAYIAAADALSFITFTFPIDLEGNEIPQSITWVNELVEASDRLDSSREEWQSALQVYRSCFK